MCLSSGKLVTVDDLRMHESVESIQEPELDLSLNHKVVLILVGLIGSGKVRFLSYRGLFLAFLLR